MRRLYLSKDLKKGKELALSIPRGRKWQQEQLCDDPKLSAYLAGLRNREANIVSWSRVCTWQLEGRK